MFKPKYDFEWNMLGIYNYNRKGKLSPYFEYLKNKIHKEGDLIEAGVYKGASLLSVALFLKEEKDCLKKVYGYDSFEGFPPIYHENDSIDKFEELYKDKQISSNHYELIKSSIRIRKLFSQNQHFGHHAVSTSGDFSNVSKNQLQKKIDFLGLDNIVLVDGPFEETMTGSFDVAPQKILGGIVDCDLYESYHTTLNFIWPKLIKGGVGLYLDEYYSLKFPGGRLAVNEFLETRNGILKKYPDDHLKFERWMLFKSR